MLAAALGWPGTLLRAQPARPAGTVPRIGYLANQSAATNTHLLGAFWQGMRELGWRDGHNIAIEYRFAEGRVERLPALAAELVREQVDVIVTVPTSATVAASKATASIPIVAISVSDPVGLGLAASLARPGANLTGLAFGVEHESITKALQLLKEAIPAARRVAVLSNPRNPAQPAAVAHVTKAGRSLGLELQLLQAGRPPRSTLRSRRWCASTRRRCSSSPSPCSSPTARASRNWRRNTGCRRCTACARTSTPAACWPTARA